MIRIKNLRKQYGDGSAACIALNDLISYPFLIATTILINVNRYVNYVLEHRDEYDSEFELISDDVSMMDNFRELIPEATQGIVLTSGTGDILYVLLFIIVTQIAAFAVISVAANQVSDNRKRRRI